MTSQMDLLYLKSTGHVLATFTRSGEPATLETTADAFVGDGLHLRGFGDESKYPSVKDFNEADLIVPGSEVGIFRTACDASVLRDPADSILANLSATPTLETILSTSDVDTATPPGIILKPPVLGATNALFVFTSSNLANSIAQSSTVNAPSSASSSQTVDITPPSSLVSGQYYCLIFVAGYPPCVAPFTVP